MNLTAMKWALVVVCLCITTSPLKADVNISTDAYSNKGTALMSPVAPMDDHALLPHIVKSYIPISSGFVNNAVSMIMGQNVFQNAPNIGVVERVLLFLATVFQAKDGGTGKVLWGASMAVTMCGLLLSGFLTFQAVSQGKKTPSEALVGITTKVVLTFILFAYLVPNIPPLLIGLSDQVTSGIDSWYNGQSGAAGNAAGSANSKDALCQIFYTKRAAARTAAWNDIFQTMGAISKALQQDPRGKQMLDKINAEVTNPGSPMGGVLDPSGDYAEWQALTSKGTTGDLNTAISDSANKIGATVIDGLQKIINTTIDSASKNTSGDQAIKGALGQVAKNIDRSNYTYPGKIEAAAAYISFCYLAISIWGMGIAALIWMMIYALPEEWQMGAVLFNGLKAGIAVVMGICLITIYVSVCVNYTTDKAQAAAVQGKSWYQKVYDNAVSVVNTVGGLASGPLNLPNLVAPLAGLVGDQMIIAMLILSAPAQAMAMVKGANGLAEHANKAMNTGGASHDLGGWLPGRTGSASTGANAGMTAGNPRSILAPQSSNN